MNPFPNPKPSPSLLLLGLAAGLSLHAGTGPLSWWRGDGDATDSAGDNHGTLLNGTAFAPGIAPGAGGQAFDFDGSDDAVQFPNPAAPIVSEGLTVAGWLRTSGTAEFSGVLSKFLQNGQTTGFQIGMSGNNGFAPNRAGILRSDLGTGNTYTTAFNLHRVDDGAPHHFAITCDGHSAVLYVDGEAGTPTAVANWIPNNAAPFVLGNDPGSGGRHFHGQLDEVTIYPRALDAVEIQALAGKPVLRIVRGNPGEAVVSWPAGALGFQLQVNDSLDPTGWIGMPGGGNNPATVPTTSGPK